MSCLDILRTKTKYLSQPIDEYFSFKWKFCLILLFYLLINQSIKDVQKTNLKKKTHKQSYG